MSTAVVLDEHHFRVCPLLLFWTNIILGSVRFHEVSWPTSLNPYGGGALHNQRQGFRSPFESSTCKASYLSPIRIQLVLTNSHKILSGGQITCQEDIQAGQAISPWHAMYLCGGLSRHRTRVFAAKTRPEMRAKATRGTEDSTKPPNSIGVATWKIFKTGSKELHFSFGVLLETTHGKCPIAMHSGLNYQVGSAKCYSGSSLISAVSRARAPDKVLPDSQLSSAQNPFTAGSTQDGKDSYRASPILLRNQVVESAKRGSLLGHPAHTLCA